MRLGLVLPMFSGDARRVLGFARRAEELGVDGVFAFDHLMPLGGPADGPAFECFATLAAVAASTSRVRVGSLVARASLRPAGSLAKLAVSVDDVSNGRMILTVGTGDELSRREHEAFGIPYLGPRERRAHLVETVAAVTALLGGRAWAGGDSVPPIAGPLLPPPRNGPEVWIGGTSEAAVRSAAELADGWNGWGLPVPVFAERAALLRDASGGREVAPTWGGVALVGRDRAELDALVERRIADGKAPPPGAWVVDADGLVDGLRGLRDAGAAWAILLVSGGRDRVELIAEVALPALGPDR